MSVLSKAQQGGLTEDNNPENAKPYQNITENASQRSDEFLGKSANSKTYGGQQTPVGEANQSGLHQSKNADPGFSG